MAKIFKYTVSDGFDLELLSLNLRAGLEAREFVVTISPQSCNTVNITCEKNCRGFFMILGLGQRKTICCSCWENMLVVEYTNSEMVGKGIAIVIATLLSSTLGGIFLITAIIGLVKQSKLPKIINKEIAQNIAGMR